jgi:lysyl-tRNA synthetase class 2
MQGKEWWRKETFAVRLPALRTRARALAAIRAFFDARDFIEVETPALQISPGLEPHLKAIQVELGEPFGMSHQTLYLHTSPEFTMKKLLAAGVPRIFQVAHVWRDEQRSPLHHPEFTLLEWYRVNQDLDSLIEDCAGLMQAAAESAGTLEFRHGTMACDPFAPVERLTVAEAFERYCGIDLFTAIGRDDLAHEARRIGLHVGESDQWDDIFHRIMGERVEGKLGIGRPTALTDYPIALAALARPNPHDSRVAERFELYACGIELANAFAELTDVAIQRQRFAADCEAKSRLYGETYPIDEDFMAALADMPDACGIALGFDRLVMLAARAARIEDVLWAPVAEPQ